MSDLMKAFNDDRKVWDWDGRNFIEMRGAVYYNGQIDRLAGA